MWCASVLQAENKVSCYKFLYSLCSLNTVRTVKVASVILRLQLRNELCLLPQETVPVQISKKTVLFHLKRTPCETGREKTSSNISQKQRYRMAFKSSFCSGLFIQEIKKSESV